MSRKLVSIQIVDDVFPIENADRIECIVIGGWEVVCLKGQLKKGQLCLFYEIDSFLPVDPRYEFLRKSSFRAFDGMEGFRLKTIRLKGTLSQGLALPLTQFPEVTNPSLGDDLTELLKVVKYEKPTKGLLSGDSAGLFPSHTPKTDADRIQNNQRAIQKHQDALVEVSVKMDGSSFTCYHKDGQFGVCSRNLEKKRGDNIFWRIAVEYGLEARLCRLGRNVSIQGELVGPGIQKNKDRFDKNKLLVFNVFDIDKGEYLSIHGQQDSWTDFIEDLNRYYELEFPPIETVEILTVDTVFKGKTVKDILAMGNGKSRNNPLQEREGVVFKFDEVLPSGKKIRHTLKAISNAFLLVSEDQEPENPDLV